MALLEDGVESGHADPATTTGPAQELVAERWRLAGALQPAAGR